MRIAVTVGAAVFVAALVAACSSGGGHETQPSSQPRMSMPAGAPHTKTPTSTPTTTSALPTTAPAAGTPMNRVIKWVETGTSADPSGFHTATRDGQSTDLGNEIAFVAPSGTARCATNKYADGQLACLIKADGLPSKPSDVEGQWISGWVDFGGETVDIGSLHGDPGPFNDGDGAELAEGKSLAFGDYRCRADATALVCVNYAHQSAVRLSSSGVEPFGCLKPVPPPVGIGRQLACAPD